LSSDIAPDHVFGGERHHRHDQQHEQVFFLRRIERITENDHRLRGNHARRIVVGEPAHFCQAPENEELCGERGDREVEAAYAQAWQPEQDADGRRRDAPAREGQQ
jgi:hypothetical protein